MATLKWSTRSPKNNFEKSLCQFVTRVLCSNFACYTFKSMRFLTMLLGRQTFSLFMHFKVGPATVSPKQNLIQVVQRRLCIVAKLKTVGLYGKTFAPPWPVRGKTHQILSLSCSKFRSRFSAYFLYNHSGSEPLSSLRSLGEVTTRS